MFRKQSNQAIASLVQSLRDWPRVDGLPMDNPLFGRRAVLLYRRLTFSE
jgi:hypothetical protein